MSKEKIMYDQEEYLLVLKHLHILQERLEAAIQENISLKELLVNNYGHKLEKIVELNSKNFKKQPSYILGKSIIEGTKSVNGFLAAPQKIYSYYKNKDSYVYIKSSDENEIEKISKLENHLSYRIGSVIDKNIKSKKNFFKIPYLIAIQMKEYKFKK